MADILISKFTTQIPRVGATPATPGFAESEGQDPVAPSGTPQVYTPVTIGSPANGLSISGTQVLTIVLASTSTTGALSSTDWNTFNGKLNLTSPITGYAVGANTALADTDTILQAFGKVQGQINARISGTIASGQVAFGTGVNTVGGSARFTYGDNSQLLVNNTVSASVAIARGINFTPTLTATANNDVLVGLNISPTFNLGGFSNLSLNAFRISVASNNLFLGRSEGIQIIGNQAGHSPALFLTATSTGGRNYRLASWQDGVTGYFTIRDDGAGVDVFNIDASRRVGILTTSPTNTLDVNGTARIRTISNLGSAATSVLVPSATGVVSLRTLAEFASDGGFAIESAFQVVSTSGTITNLVATSNRIVFTGTNPEIAGITGGVNGKTIQILFLGTGILTISAGGAAGNPFHPTSLSFVGVGKAIEAVYYNGFWWSNDGLGQTVLVNGTTVTFQNIIGRIGINRTSVGGAGTLLLAPTTGSTRCLDIYDGSANLNGWFDSTGQLFHARSTTSNQSARRDELYLNYSETVATAGTINDLVINASTKLLILTGATDLTGVVPVDNTRLLRIEARSASRIIRHESASSTAANRFSIGADLTINAGEVYQFIYTDSRWRFINDTRDQFAVKTTATADQTLPSGVLTILDYDSTLLNNSTNTYTVGTNGRITINRTGIYTITAGVVIEADAVTALESAFLGIFRNGDLVAISSINTTIAAGAQSGLSTSTILSLTATDIIDCRALVNSVGGVANGLARRLGTLLGANATQVNSLSITKNSM